MQEIKALAKPEFQANPEKFYPVETIKRYGFSRYFCDKCKAPFWRHNDRVTLCGDSNCVGRYSFIGEQRGIGKDHHVTYEEAFETFRSSFVEKARIKHTCIKRYPVVARWRQDVDFVAAGIFCFQPSCVTGELEPPANPLICPQFCLRFNDLDSIGITGRHYSGFIMLGIQVFNRPDRFVYFKEECTEFNLEWLINGLGIDPDEITLIEDVWAGGGNLGPSIEYFVGGLEVGNMVFMQYSVNPVDASRRELELQVIDVGAGLERVPWLLNGTPTSYVDVFPGALQHLQSVTGLPVQNEAWRKFGPLSCVLNADEVDNMDDAWARIATELQVDAKQLQDDIAPIRDMFIVCDHTRTVLMAIEDGSLPSNIGGAANVRQVLRRVFALLKKHQWWEKLGMDGLIKLFDLHREDLSRIYGPFQPYPSFRDIIEIEYQRWSTSEETARKQLASIMAKRKNVLGVDDWITAIISFGLDADTISEITKLPVPSSLFLRLAEFQERTARVTPHELYSTVTLPGTRELYYNLPTPSQFDANVVAVFANKTHNDVENLVVLDQTGLYPTGGGQDHDCGQLVVGSETYAVVDVFKAGNCVMHVLDRAIAGGQAAVGAAVHGTVDMVRREQLRNHHTATHMMCAAARKVLGPHIWQNGAKKTVDYAHLDITHYRSLSHEEEQAIENEVNRIARSCVDIHKYELAKEKAEEKHGFSLYQGGIVPGNTLRIVDILDTDTEACCGTHCDNTAQVGFVKIIRSKRVSDGVVRIQFVAGERALGYANSESDILHHLKTTWGIAEEEIVKTADRFFDGHKRAEKQSGQLATLTVRVAVLELLGDADTRVAFIKTDQPDPTMFISLTPSFAERLKAAGKGLVFVGATFVYGLLGNPALVDVNALEAALQADDAAAPAAKPGKKLIVKDKLQVKAGKSKITVGGICEFRSFSSKQATVVASLVAQNILDYTSRM